MCTRILRLRSGLEIEKGTIENPDPVRGTGDFGPRVVRADTRVQGRAGSEGPARLHVSRREPPSPAEERGVTLDPQLRAKENKE